MKAINTTEESKFYTANGWEGSKYQIHKGAKEVAKELREYIKKDPELNACKWSITSKWGMIADRLTVSLIAAPFDPFTEEYKKRHEYRYERGYSEHGTLSDYTTEPALKVIKKVQSFVMQYIHDDSDGMIDYFDRNIYDYYEIGKYDKPFQLIEVEQTKESDKNENKPGTIGLFEIVDYSEKAVAVFGDTKTIKDELKSIGGKFNPRLNYNGGKRAGWVFPKSKRETLENVLKGIDTNGELQENDNNTVIDRPNDKDERPDMNPEEFTKFSLLVQNIAVNEGYFHARNHVKEELKRYKIDMGRLKYIVFLLSEYRKRDVNERITGAA